MCKGFDVVPLFICVDVSAHRLQRKLSLSCQAWLIAAEQALSFKVVRLCLSVEMAVIGTWL